MKILFIFLTFLLMSDIAVPQWYPIGTNNSGFFVIVSFANENTGWGVRNDPMRIFKTVDGGGTWSIKYQPTAPITSIFFLDEQIGWFSTIQGNLFYTSDGGDNWAIRFSGLYWHMEDIYFFDSLNGIAAGNDGAGTIFKTTDGGSNWQLVHQEEQGTALNFLNNSIGWCGSFGKLLKTTNDGENWNLLPGVISGRIGKVNFLIESIGWLSSYDNDSLYFTSDGGNSWITRLTNVVDFYFTDLNYGWYTNGEKIFNTNNGGVSWVEQYSDTIGIVNLYFLNSNLGWAVNNNGLVIHTTNGGTPVELISFSTSVENSDVTLNWITGSEINNSGFEIEKKSGEINNPPSNDEWEKIGFISGNGTTTEQQFYSFVDKNFTSGKYQYRLKQIDFDGTFEYSTIVEVELENFPTEFSVKQNFPNPFNPSTRIEFSIPTDNNIEIKVFNVLGMEVATLLNEQRQAGTHSVEFSTISGASNLSSGIYFYKISAGKNSETKKMLLVR
ncbi:MAG: T9SS type A sorting domain-containing protein [Ignavibacteriaceae bacterium]|nr:T9SS type A sorting domain-containing protein [Ignavibacteriaceae bacterium]